MIIRFGLAQDGKIPERSETKIGYVSTGPQGFLSILETQLGLTVPDISPNTGTFVQNVHSDSRTSVASGMHVPHGRPDCWAISFICGLGFALWVGLEIIQSKGLDGILGEILAIGLSGVLFGFLIISLHYFWRTR